MTWEPMRLPPAPAPTRPGVMAQKKRRDTAPELALRRGLWALGLRFLVDVPAPGTGRRRRVDVLLRGGRVAVIALRLRDLQHARRPAVKRG